MGHTEKVAFNQRVEENEVQSHCKICAKTFQTGLEQKSLVGAGWLVGLRNRSSGSGWNMECTGKGVGGGELRGGNRTGLVG